MSDETTIEGELTVEDIIGEAKGAGYHTILEIWQKVIAPGRTERHKPIAPQWSVRIITQYPGIGFTDMPQFRDLYFDKIQELEMILEASIEEDPECLTPTTAEEDVEANGARYIRIITDWQKAALLWELGWDPQMPTAAIEVAAISEVHKMFFAQEGLITLLDQINLEFTDENRQALSDELEEMKAAEGR